MPLSSDPQIVKLGEDLIAQFQSIFGKHPGYRPSKQYSYHVYFLPPSFVAHLLQLFTDTALFPFAAHAKGDYGLWDLYTNLSRSPPLARLHTFTLNQTPITVRFSDTTGIPNIPDTAPEASPRGFGLRFPSRRPRPTPTSSPIRLPTSPSTMARIFLELLKGIASSPPGTPSPSPIEKFLGGHPAAF